MTSIEINGLYKAYMNRKGDTAAVVLQNVSMKIDEGEFVCLIGPSGCGKTTILNIIAGFEKPTKGKVMYSGKDISESQGVFGVVFQEYSLLPWMNVLQNVIFGLEGKNIPKTEKEKIAKECLTAVGLSEHLDQRPNLLSGGMKQRVAIARMLAMDPDVMLMDEPFSNLDEQTRKMLDRQVTKIWEEKRKTVLFVTHNVDEAIMLGSRIVMLSSAPGKLIKEWNVSGGHKRYGSRDYLDLRNDIMRNLQSCSCAGPDPDIRITEIKDTEE
ncbi:MAG: ABC transporter ATP-binding protein [Methanomassiliicoccaceae archaeon]|nr:ABC transporter ATP-binding protein [Methanomassiliicoccaceae archaeon]